LDAARKGFMEDLKVTLSNDAGLAGSLTRNLYLDRTMKFLEKRVADIQSLKPEQVQAAAKKYLSPDKLVVVCAGDLDKKAEAGAAAPSGGTN
jgi:zinc protease